MLDRQEITNLRYYIRKFYDNDVDSDDLFQVVRLAGELVDEVDRLVADHKCGEQYIHGCCDVCAELKHLMKVDDKGLRFY